MSRFSGLSFSHRNASDHVLLDHLKLRVVLKDVIEKSVTDEWWDESKHIAEEAYKTPFILGMNNGTASPDDYGQFNLQDFIFLYNGALNLQTLANLAGTLAGHRYEVLKSFAEERSAEWFSYWERYRTQWHIKEASAIVLKEGGAIKKYIDFKTSLLPATVSDGEPLIMFLVAMIPCEKLWPWLGRKLFNNNINVDLKLNNPYFNAWIQPNNPPDSTPFPPKGAVELFVESYFSGYDKQKALHIYRTTFNYEKEFFLSATPPIDISRDNVHVESFTKEQSLTSEQD